jgi:hypothetical protein
MKIRPDIDGPYYPRPTPRQILLSGVLHALGFLFIGALLAYAVIGMAGGFE